MAVHVQAGGDRHAGRALGGLGDSILLLFLVKDQAVVALDLHPM